MNRYATLSSGNAVNDFSYCKTPTANCFGVDLWNMFHRVFSHEVVAFISHGRESVVFAALILPVAKR